ncbi:helix-turn-helix domain-containing protein [Mucilaginibacter sp. RCC_168]|uniref:helix-turn-helix domain-containing protein n=1 Tax=Mucilaginibacter sp. RCC_168 TaxID=3239221 RepID=UPI003526A3A1
MLPVLSAIAEKELKDSFSIKYCESQSYDQSAAYRLTYNRVLLVEVGHGEIKIDDRTFSMNSHGLFLIAKGQILSFQPKSGFKGYDLSFGDCFWEKTPPSASNCKAVLFNNAAANQNLPLGDEDHGELVFLFQQLYREFSKEEYSNKLDAMAAYLKIIMIKMANIHTALAKGFDSFENKTYRKFLELISLHYHDTHEVAEYASLLGISARTLTELTKRCCGRGAKDLINGQLIAEAKRSLQFSSAPVKEIAYQLHFSTPDQFSHFFKKNAQLSPQDYRTLFLNMGV